MSFSPPKGAKGDAGAKAGAKSGDKSTDEAGRAKQQELARQLAAAEAEADEASKLTNEAVAARAQAQHAAESAFAPSFERVSDDEDEPDAASTLQRLRVRLSEKEASLTRTQKEAFALAEELNGARARLHDAGERASAGVDGVADDVRAGMRSVDAPTLAALRGLDVFKALEQLVVEYTRLCARRHDERARSTEAPPVGSSNSSVAFQVQQLQNLLNLRDRQVHTLLDAARVRVRTSPRTVPSVWESGASVSSNDYFSAIDFAGRSKGGPVPEFATPLPNGAPPPRPRTPKGAARKSPEREAARADAAREVGGAPVGATRRDSSTSDDGPEAARELASELARLSEGRLGGRRPGSAGRPTSAGRDKSPPSLTTIANVTTTTTAPLVRPSSSVPALSLHRRRPATATTAGTTPAGGTGEIKSGVARLDTAKESTRSTVTLQRTPSSRPRTPSEHRARSAHAGARAAGGSATSPSAGAYAEHSFPPSGPATAPNPFGASASLELHATSAWPAQGWPAGKMRPGTAGSLTKRSMSMSFIPPSDTRSAFVVRQVGEMAVPKLAAGEQLMPMISVSAGRGAFAHPASGAQ